MPTMQESKSGDIGNGRLSTGERWKGHQENGKRRPHKTAAPDSAQPSLLEGHPLKTVFHLQDEEVIASVWSENMLHDYLPPEHGNHWESWRSLKQVKPDPPRMYLSLIEVDAIVFPKWSLQVVTINDLLLGDFLFLFAYVSFTAESYVGCCTNLWLRKA